MNPTYATLETVPSGAVPKTAAQLDAEIAEALGKQGPR